MDINAITDFISTLGFPIFMAVWLLIKDSRADTERKEQIKELKTAIENNTKSVEKLELLMDKIMDKLGDKLGGDE